MKRYILTVFSIFVLLPGVLFIVPTTMADTFTPPGPPSDYSEWIYKGLHVYDLQWPCCTPISDINELLPIGWMYTEGPSYDPLTQTVEPKVEYCSPEIEGPLWIPFSTWVMVFGVIPGVSVSPDQMPPSVVLVIEWNGIPYAVTLEAPDVVGMQYPPEKHGELVPHVPEGIRDQLPSMETVYPWVYPQEGHTRTPSDGTGTDDCKKAYYNVWVGDWDCATGPMPHGLYFWYIFHPNVGDWIAFNCEGWTKHPPTYDIYGLLEYSNSQIWLNHKCFDVRLLEVHKEIEPDWIPSGAIFGAPEISNILTITNVGKVPAHDIDITESFPTEPKKAVIPKWDTATIKIFGGRHIFAEPLPIREAVGTYGWPYKLPPPFDVLYPGETMVISMEASVNIDEEWDGSFIIDAMVSAHEIPPWKYPRAMDMLVVGFPTEITVLYELVTLEQVCDSVVRLPPDPVTMTVYDGTSSYFDTVLSDVPAEYDVTDGTYPGWCADRRFDIPRAPATHSVTLYDSSKPSTLPNDINDEDWDMVNYILNHKQGEMMDVQEAIWYFVNFVGGYSVSTPTAQAMVNDALVKGDGFLPGAGETLAVICYPEERTQITIIEILKPCRPFGTCVKRVITAPLPVNWNEIPQTCEFELTLDPEPLDLNHDGVIDAQDVDLVRKAIVGLIAYDLRMDVNANSKVDTEDLAAYKLAAFE